MVDDLVLIVDGLHEDVVLFNVPSVDWLLPYNFGSNVGHILSLFTLVIGLLMPDLNALGKV